MIMMDKNASPDILEFVIKRLASTMVVAIAVAAITSLNAQATPTASNQNAPGLADTPGSKASIAASDKTLTEGSLKLQDGLALLDSSVLLKVYYYAYSGTPVDYSEILTENTENIIQPNPVQASNEQKKVIDRLIQIAKTKPDLLIKVDDIALDSYDKTSRSFPVVNRLFMKGARFYFDNSRYHYHYSDAGTFGALRCADSKTIAAINSSVANYEHFSMDIVAHVNHAVAKEDTLVFDLHKVTLKDSSGHLLITQVKP
jgi:hypothetical protein